MHKTEKICITEANTKKSPGLIRLFFFVIVFGAGISGYANSSYSQAKKINLNVSQETVGNIIKLIEEEGEYIFLYNDRTLDLNRKVTINAENKTIEQILDLLFANTDNLYKISDRQIYISKKDAPAKISEQPQDKDITIEGMVISSSDNKPLVGVSVFVQGTTIGTQTDSDGIYRLKIPSKTEQITFSCIGFDTKKINVADSYLFKLVTLVEQINKLDDVVVVGFGTQKKENVVGAVEAIQPSDLSITSSNLSTSFIGKIAGVVGYQSSGEPGYDDVTFYIRGLSTFGSNKSPLIIMDGVEILARMLNNIPPETIESFSVLKDATATSLYGSRGANGVIIITTKTGNASEKMHVNARIENTISFPTFIQDIADGVTYMEAYNEAYKNRLGDNWVSDFYSEEKIEGTRNHLNPYIYPDNDWYSMLFKDLSVNQNFNFNMSGGTQKIDYFLSATIFNEQGIIKQPKEEDICDVEMNSRKFLFQSNVSAMVTPTTKIGLKMNSQLWYNNRPYKSSSDLFFYTMRANPVRFPAVLPAEEGDTYVLYGNNTSWDVGSIDTNPYALLASGYANRYYSYLTTALTGEQDLSFVTKGLKAKGMVSFYNYTYSQVYRTFTPYYFKVSEDYTENEDGTYDYETESIGDAGSTYLTTGTSRGGHREYSVQFTLDYNRKFNNHDIGAVAVFHAKEKMLNTPTTDEDDILPYRQMGTAGRLSYNYDTRYFAEFAFGYNGSENFISGKRFGFFPSLAIGYTISNESFFEPLKKVVSNLKLKGSYGLAGNDALSSRFPYLTSVDMDESFSFYKGVNFSSTSGPVISVYGNENATWEKAKKLNIGFDLGLFEAFNISADFYSEKRTGIFMQRQSLPSSAGLSGSTPYANIGKMNNHGIDVTIEYNKAFNKDLILSARGTFTYAHNEVKDQDEPKLTPYYSSVIGHPYNTVYGYVADGLFSSDEDINANPSQNSIDSDYKPGDIKYRDLNGDGIVDANDITAIGRPTLPEIIYGFGANISYKKWDMSFYFQGTARVSLEMSDMHPFADESHFGYNITQYIVDDHWSEENPDANAKYPRLTDQWSVNNTQESSYWMRNGAYLRLKSAEIGYNLKKFVRFYLAGSNLLTFSAFTLWDPEMGSGNGLDYPLQTTVKVGVQFQF